jgi:hypothetical protein
VRDRAADGSAGSGPGVRDQSGGGSDSVPSGYRVEWGADRLSLGCRAEAAAAGTGEAVEVRGGYPSPLCALCFAISFISLKFTAYAVLLIHDK